MKYNVKTTASAEADILRSFEWGVQNWGAPMAKRWTIQLRKRFKEQLSQFPLSCPLAPDQDINEPDARQLIVDRYRVIYEIEGSLVRILHVRGPFVPPDSDENGVDK